MTEHQRIIHTIGTGLVEQLLAKNQDYGSSVFNRPILAQELAPDVAIRVRMSDKIERIKHLLTHAAKTTEPLDDSLMDLAGYCILLLAQRAINPPGPPIEHGY